MGALGADACDRTQGVRFRTLRAFPLGSEVFAYRRIALLCRALNALTLRSSPETFARYCIGRSWERLQ